MRHVLTIAMFPVLAAISHGAMAAKLQCWVDENGARACGDRVPPQYADRERQLLNKQGIVVGKKDRQKTDAELAEDRRRANAVADEQKRQREQAAYDLYMLQTFESVSQMQGVRDTRLSALDGRLRLAEKSAADAEVSLQGLRERLAALEKNGKTDVRIKKQVTEFEASLVDALKSVAALKKEREEVSFKFDADVERYRKLRAGQIQVGSAPQAPPEAAETQ